MMTAMSGFLLCRNDAYLARRGEHGAAPVAFGSLNPACMLVITLLLCACDRWERQTGASDPNSAGAQTQAASPWRTSENEPVVAVDDQATQRELDAAIAEARATAESARARWQQAGAEERRRWAVKWAAPIDNASELGTANQVEHVWVQPLSWSAFRIEGILISEPLATITAGKNRGDLVSFPIEELSDWALFNEETVEGSVLKDGNDSFEGGFTLKVLERRYGAPPERASE
jgi:uncharacterized protein YegJ (DUF2314 family)